MDETVFYRISAFDASGALVAQAILAGPGDEVWIGRDDPVHLHLTDEGVAPVHACLYLEAGQVFIEDHSDGVGIFQRGEAITEPTTVSAGERLALGPYQVEIAGIDGPLPGRTPPEGIDAVQEEPSKPRAAWPEPKTEVTIKAPTPSPPRTEETMILSAEDLADSTAAAPAATLHRDATHILHQDEVQRARPARRPPGGRPITAPRPAPPASDDDATHILTRPEVIWKLVVSDGAGRAVTDFIIKEGDRPVVLGRSDICAVCIDNPGLEGRHARFKTTEKGLCVEPGEANATVIVGGRRIKKRVVLEPDTRVIVGPYEVEVQLAEG